MSEWNIIENIGALLGMCTGALIVWKVQGFINISWIDALLPLFLGILICTMFRRIS